MITALEHAKNYSRLRSTVATQTLSEMCIEFAKLHVEAALKEASKHTPLGAVDLRDSILEAYPLSNIK